MVGQRCGLERFTIRHFLKSLAYARAESPDDQRLEQPTMQNRGGLENGFDDEPHQVDAQADKQGRHGGFLGPELDTCKGEGEDVVSQEAGNGVEPQTPPDLTHAAQLPGLGVEEHFHVPITEQERRHLDLVGQ